MIPALECSKLAKTYRVGFLARKVRALRGVNLSLAPGEVLGLIGPNGAGKSTTIKILLNLVLPSAGEARLFGFDVRDRRSRLGIGFVPEAPVPYEYLSGHEYLTLQAQLIGLQGARGKAEVAEALERVDMVANAQLPIRRYSKGMIQRVMLAGALLGQPRLLILDEPTSGLDPLGRRLVRDLILEQRRRGAAVLFSTHIISDAESLCDRVALLADGTIKRDGSVAALLASHETLHEVLVDGTDPRGLPEDVKRHVSRTEHLGQRALICVTDGGLQPLLQYTLATGGRVLRVQPIRFSLEDAFLETVKSATSRVGGTLE